MLIATKTAMNTPIENFNFTKYVVPLYLQFKKDIDDVSVGIHAQYSRAVDCLDTYGSVSTSLAA
jgi:hypothetical protein